MIRNIKLLIQYEGTRYQGWQRQISSSNTIQGKIESILSKMCNEKIEIQGSGRTDAGVHAKGQVANFHTKVTMSIEEMMAYINEYLPLDIAVTQIEEVPERFHSRLNAKGKRYCYQVINSSIPDVFNRRYALEFPEALDIAAMKEGAKYLCGSHDFKAFTSAKKGKKSTIRCVDEINLEQKGDLIIFTFSGNGFLYHMIRIMMGTLLEIGVGKRKADSIPELLEAKKREQTGFLVPAKGLTLMELYF